jgi:putative PIN family toxin of toxin-antitoxin system
MSKLRPDVVFDCNVLFQAMARSGGPAARALRLVEEGAVTLYLSRAVVQELRRILKYPEIRGKNVHLTDLVIATFLQRLVFRATFVRVVPHVFSYSRDPSDEPYIDLAAAVDADFVTTRDADLLSLMKDHTEEAQAFRRRFPRMRVVDPATFVNEVEALRATGA